MKLEVVNGAVFAHIDEYTYREYFTLNGVPKRVVHKLYKAFSAVNILNDNDVVFVSNHSRTPLHLFSMFDNLLKDAEVSIAPRCDYDGDPIGDYDIVVRGTVLV